MPTVVLYAMHRYRVPVLSPDELFCCPFAEDQAARIWRSPIGVYDVGTFLGTLPEADRRPYVLVVAHDLFEQTQPVNLGAVGCPRILIVSDTHHQGRAIRKAIAYAKSEPFDLIIGEFDRQHLHFFVEAGLTQTRWLPCFNITPYEHAPQVNRPNDVRFLGSMDPTSSVYRCYVLQELQDRGVAVQTGKGGRSEVARGYSETKVNLNISLNGDLNLRVLEVLAAGSFLLTERLSPESGMSLLFKEGKHLVTFESIEHLQELIGRYLWERPAAEAIAAAGHAEYMRRHRPLQKIQDVSDMLSGKAAALSDPRLDRRTALPAQAYEEVLARVGVYELLQELHRTHAAMTVLFWPSAERESCDAVDLPRLKGTLVGSAEGGKLLKVAGLEGRVRRVERDSAEMEEAKWNVVVCRAGDLAHPVFQKLWQRGAVEMVAICPGWSAEEGEVMRRETERLGMKTVNEDPWAFGR